MMGRGKRLRLIEVGQWKLLGALEEAPAQIRALGFNTDADAISRALREDLKMELRGGERHPRNHRRS